MPCSLPQLLETIRVENGQIRNLSYHQERMNRSREALFHLTVPIDLSAYLVPPASKGLFRCRVCYAKKIEKIEYLPYIPKPIKRLKLVSTSIEYPYKYADRTILNDLLSRYPDADEVIIEKEGLITDTTISNLAFYKDGEWFTPQKPLLEGTMRAKLLDNGMLTPCKIKKEMLSDYTHVALINAMLGFRILNDIIIE
jgi:4-amino-4-deoxychorismate lyase